MAQAESDAKQVHSQAQVQIAEEREAMLRGARNEVAALALLAAGKVAGRAMDSAAEQAMVESFLAEVGERT